MEKRMDIESKDYGNGGVFVINWRAGSECETCLTLLTLEKVLKVARAKEALGVGSGLASCLLVRDWIDLASAHEFKEPMTEAEIAASELFSVVWVQKGAVVV